MAIIGGSGTRPPPWLENASACTGSTPYGEPSDAPLLGFVHGREVLYLARHGLTHRLLPHEVNYRANVWMLRNAGACRVVAVNAVGGITHGMSPGRIVIPSQLIDYTWGRAHTYAGQGASVPPAGMHTEFTEPYAHAERCALLAAARAAGVQALDGGVYGAVQGPRLETAAEILRMGRDGCDLVGMTGMPEASLAAELRLPYASLAVVANWAAGCSPQALSEEAMRANLAGVQEDVECVLRHWVTGPAGP